MPDPIFRLKSFRHTTLAERKKFLFKSPDNKLNLKLSTGIQISPAAMVLNNGYSGMHLISQLIWYRSNVSIGVPVTYKKY